MSEEFEQLSRYRAGELSPEAARALEAQAGFAERLRQLQVLDAAVGSLPVGLSEAKLEALIARVRRPEPKRRTPGLELWVGLAAAAVGLCFLGWTFLGAPAEQWGVVPTGEVKVDGKTLTAPATLGGARWLLEVARAASAQLDGQGATVLMPGGAQLTHDKGLALTRGTAVVRAEGLTLTASGATVEVNGVSVLSMEPAEGVARVTDVLNTTRSGELMKTQWIKLSSVAVAAAMGGALTLFVIEGHASVRQGVGAPVVVSAGEQWKGGDARPSASRPLALTGEPTRIPAPSALQAMTQPQLIAMVEALRDEKEALLGQREALKKKLAAETEGSHPKRNYYRFEPAELLASAQKGELRLRGPQLSGEPIKVDDKVRDELGLTPEEVAKVRELFEGSSARTRTGLLKIYKEIGGDPNLASTLGTETIFNELRAKALKDDFAEAVRTLADERAGLRPRGNPEDGVAVMRAFRLFLVEDERMIDELERLLGPRRAEEFLNHPKGFHSDNTFGVGPRKSGD